MMRRLAAASAFAVTSIASSLAQADVGPPDDSCTVDKRCKGEGVSCPYVRPNPDAGADCRAGAAAKGLELVCSHGGGTVGDEVFCPKGKSSAVGSTSTSPSASAPSASAAGPGAAGGPRGCSSCTVRRTSSEGAGAAVGLALAACAVLAGRRRRRG